ncbi:MAG: hypothetical protein KDK37_15665, partial [Leptospiraceae bacterium]|nr:hypothetical protein [Leptospiraceae bacterium]
LTEGQPFIHVAHWKQTGELATNPDESSYLPFQAEQTANARKPAFLWNARVSVAPVLFIRVADSYINGIASGSVYLLSAIPMANRSAEKELNQGALFRYLAESVWYPTALLPENGVKWRSIDSHRALATLSDGGNTVSLEFRFSEDGLVQSIYTQDRPGLFDGEYVTYPWEGRFQDYRKVDGMMIPFRGEVGWHLPEGFWLFWKGDLDRIQFQWQ